MSWQLGLCPRPHHYVVHQNSSLVVPTVYASIILNQAISNILADLISLRAGAVMLTSCTLKLQGPS